MTLPMVTCPLCCRPGFTTSQALCAALVDITTRKLCCPVCNELIHGVDKFTIHLFSHSMGKLNAKDASDFSINAINKSLKNEPLNSSTKSLKLQSQETDKLLITSNVSSTAQSNVVAGTSYNAMTNPQSNIPDLENSLVYFRTDNGQIFALTQDSLKNITINTQNFITNTNITTSGNSFNAEKNCTIEKKKTGQKLDEVGNDETHVVDDRADAKVQTNQREFESCRDLITRGDFSTSIDELLDPSISKGLYSHEKANNEICLGGKKDDVYLEPTTSCDLCKFVFPNKTLLAMHIQIVHKKVEIESENKRKLFSCNICPKTFKMRGSLMLHRRVAHSGGFGNLESNDTVKEVPPKPSCTICGKYFKKEVHLAQHMKAHDVKQWHCAICSKTFSTKYFLKKHRRLHTGEMPYKCEKCNKTFTFQQSYNKHLSYHTNDKPYCCSHCGRLFKELSTLHNHERIHSGEKPFPCETCGPDTNIVLVLLIFSINIV